MNPHDPYVLTPEDRWEFLQFLKGVKVPDGFCSNLKKKVIDNDSNIIGLKSHDCHVIMQWLLSMGIRKFLLESISGTIMELCNFFRQLCSQTLNVNDMEKSQREVIHILCKMELIFPPAFFWHNDTFGLAFSRRGFIGWASIYEMYVSIWKIHEKIKKLR